MCFACLSFLFDVGLPFAAHDDSAEQRTCTEETEDLNRGGSNEESRHRDDDHECENYFHGGIGM